MAKIKEVIVVEGKDDITAVKAAVDAELFAVSGFGVQNPKTLAELQAIHERTGLIIFTDPDHAGEKIRAILSKHIPGAKHAFLAKKQGYRERDGKYGVEYASPAAIRHALAQSKYELLTSTGQFTIADLQEYGLCGHPNAQRRRFLAGEMLSIGHTNAKQFLRRLNHFGIERSEFKHAVSLLD
ncbi:MAG: ribonuclease M5 [Deltaproteobacteria bacterium]|nr:ribonuclease M5 [Deltaproteobacteria bacterium]MBU48890.1 ribonuclease M5 [Deltaproteobacteria bacterium]|tara:strand:+ start:13782 stop:14330 length:549 start_codon:yes stop_codon:yes gene_type:complete